MATLATGGVVLAGATRRDVAKPVATKAGGSAFATTATGPHGAVATDQRLATQTGLRILREGGNAVDAAIAIGYTLAVTFPAAGNLGGGGFMLIRFAGGGSHFIDFRETAPAEARPNMYLDRRGREIPDLSIAGPLAAGVPGSVAGLEYARARYATLARSDLIRDAIGYASNGFTLTRADAAYFAYDKALLMKYSATRAIFAGAVARAPAAGTVLRQPDLARTLRLIVARGRDGFYRGEVAHRLAAAVQASGGIITTSDLARYRAIERSSLACSYRGYRLLTAPLPSSGGIAICEILGMLSRDAPGPAPRNLVATHYELEAERRAFADRNTQLGDPAFVHSAVASLLAPEYLARQRATIAPNRATPSSEVRGGGIVSHEGTNTTNYSVVDAAGNAVDVTYTINNLFGSGFVAGTTGVLLNDEMDDFTTRVGSPNLFGLIQGAANAITPGKRPLSSMSPTIAVGPGARTVLALGAAGGPRIITTTLDALRAVIDYGETPGQALAAPRMHMQWLPDLVYAEPKTFTPVTLAGLRRMGYDIRFGPADSAANAVEILRQPRRFAAAHDPRVTTGDALAY
jgi:gamma-glutamyltranspeptidase/glutathione hydrolase